MKITSKFVAVTLASFLANHAAHAIQTDNLGLHAVPTPSKVAIDGKLDDWDLSGQVLMTYDIETLRDVYSAQVSTMYDADNLYVSVHWKDPIPFGNSHDPRYQAAKGWAGDCVQLRIKTDRISHITAWYYAPKQEPAMTVAYGKSLTEPFDGGEVQLFRTQDNRLDQGAEMSFLKDADGKGYVQEIKIPWKVITKEKQYKPDDEFSMGFELLWGEADWPVHRYADNLQPTATSREFFWTAHNAWGSVTLEPKGNLKLPQPLYMVAYEKAVQGETPTGPVNISYDLPKDARVSLVIDDASGKRVRNLVPALARKKGPNVEKWDGMDDDGKPVSPGQYSYKALFHDGIHANWQMSFANPGNPTWPTPDGKGAFYGDHSAPQAVATSGKLVALACPIGEAGQYLIGADLNGQRQWGLANRGAFYAGRVSLATDEKTLWVGQDKTGTVYRVDMASGKYSPWNKTAKDETGKEYKVLDLKVSNLPRDDNKAPTNLTGLAVSGNTAGIAFAVENKVKLIDATTGAVQKELTVPSPQTITVNGDGWLVLSQNKVLRIDAKGGISPFAATPITDAYALTTDSKGNVYVSVRGAQQNVKVLSPKGQLLREIGVKGGRPDVGAYNADGMRNPAGLAVDSLNRLWVTEETTNPKRTSVWDTTTGKLVKDLVGTTSYSGAGSINPDDPTMAFSDNTVYKINLETGAWTPVYSLGKTTSTDDLFPLRADSRSRIFNRGGNTYLYSSDRTGSIRCSVLSKGKWRAAAFVGTVRKELDPEVNAAFTHPYLKDHVGEIVGWADSSGDGLVQPNELSFWKPTFESKPISLNAFYWGSLPDDKGTISFVAPQTSSLVKFGVKSFTPNGAPIYDVSQPQILKVASPFKLGQDGGMIMSGKNDQVYINQSPFTAIDGKGNVVFTYPSRHVSVHGSHTAKASRPGYLIGPSAILGTADVGGETGEVIYLNGNLGENYLFTHDGLYIQTLFKDTRGYFDTPSQAVKGMSFDATTAGGESFGGQFMKTANGKTYVVLGGTDARVIEVTGLNSIKRLAGKVNYSPDQYAQAQILMQQRIAESSAARDFTIKLAANAPTIDGNSQEWGELLDGNSKILEIQDSPERRYGRVAMRYDANNLYLGYRVFAPRGAMVNVAQDSRLLFKSGDVVDLMLGPSRADAGTVIAGDTRILMTIMGGKPVAVLNQKVAPNAPNSEKFGFSSPWRTIQFDRVAEIPEAKMATSAIGGGYFVEASIPWATLGIKPQVGLKLRGDVGVLFADNGGTTTVSRQYWSNKAAGLVNDVPGEADLTPNLWGTFTLE